MQVLMFLNIVEIMKVDYITCCVYVIYVNSPEISTSEN